MREVLSIHDLVVRRSGRAILSVDQLTINEGEVLTVIGPNGAGKSTLLLCLAHLIQADEGQILYQGRPLPSNSGLTYRRHLGLVLQAPLLLDRSVFDNVAAGLRFRHLPRETVRRQVIEWLQRLDIAHLSGRPALQLSGGEAQRVSLARAFALEPALLLLDEPFTSLDAPTRARMIEDFQTILSDTSVTTLFVTHDMNEALMVGDRVAVLLDGRIRQVGPVDQVFQAPADPEVAAFVGVETAVAGQVLAADNGHLTVEVGMHKLEAIGDLAPGRKVLFCIRPEDITLWSGDSLPPSSARNQLAGPIVRMIPKGPLMHIVVDCAFPVAVLVTRTSSQQMGLALEQKVTLTFKASAVHLIPR